ncbi:unnamed protein product [Gongylonema pulchrum]|uniref:Uncharacterized protein n=1 Tax=Gongylonema pulchrum TaxID=637853 RepID=A0A3P7NTR9_9BILA|nr:unnamed protein product [Gongylonema pulchrum]
MLGTTANSEESVLTGVSDDALSTLKSFLECFGSYDVADVLNDLSAQTYGMLLASSTNSLFLPLAIANDDDRLLEDVLKPKSKSSLRRPQKIVQRCELRGVLPASNKFLSVVDEDIQKRTLKTTSTSAFVHEAASAMVTSCRRKDLLVNREEGSAPLSIPEKTPMQPEQKLKIASVEQLKQLADRKDYDGLRQLLSEHRWPPYRHLKTFISQIFNVFIVDAESVEGAIWLMDNFASVNSRVVLPNTIILLLLTRIVRDKGVKAATDYAHHYRNLFLVRPRTIFIFMLLFVRRHITEL